jgi:hypothetical protein
MGVIYDPRGIILVTYSWALGLLSNNLAKGYGLYKRLRVSLDNIVQKLIVYRVSFPLVSHLIKGSISIDSMLALVLCQIPQLASKFL